MTELLEIFDGRTVAVVGNGQEVADHSDEIDGCDVVVRFNHFYNYDSGFVGKRVDVIVQTFTTAWAKAENKHADVIKKYGARIFCGKKPEQYNPSEVARFLGPDVCVSDWSSEMEPWSRFTTGGAFLCWLASKPRNSEFRIFGFPMGEAADKYFGTDAKQYRDVKYEELVSQQRAIEVLRQQKIRTPRTEAPVPIIVPLKASSAGCPGKNEKLLPGCLAKLKRLGMPIVLVGDAKDLIDAHTGDGVSGFITPPPSGEITDDLRLWRDHTGYHGVVAHVQCTSPRLDEKWVLQCLEAKKHAPVAATCAKVDFKINGIYSESNGIYMQLVPQFGPASVPRQKLPPSVHLTGAAYAFHTDALDKASFYMAGTLRPVIVEERDALDVDTPEDLARANL